MKKTGFWLSLMVSIIMVIYFFSQISLKELVKVLQNLYLPALSAYLVLALSGVGARTYRYALLLPSIRINYYKLTLVTLIRNMFVDLLPARIGSLAYVYLLTKRLGFPLETAASTFVIALLFDFLVLFPLILAALWLSPLEAFSSRQLIGFSGLVFLGLGVLVLFLDRWLEVGARGLAWGSKHLLKKAPPWVTWLTVKIRLIGQDVVAIKSRKIYGRVFFLSLAVRICKYGSLYFLLYAVLVPLHLSLPSLNFWKVFLGFLGAEFSSLLPIQGLAGIGTWEAAWVFTFRLLGFFDPQVAILSGFAVHLTTQFFEYSLGILALVLLYWPAPRPGKAKP